MKGLLRPLYNGIQHHIAAPLHYYTNFGNIIQTNRNVIIMYHSVGADKKKNHPGNIPREKLRKDIKYFKEIGGIVPLSDIMEGQQNERRVALTFDDGLKNFYENALPILANYDVPATVFLNPSFTSDVCREEIIQSLDIDGRHVSDDEDIVMSQEEIRELAQNPNIAVENHTKTHPRLSEISDKDLLHNEIVESKKTIENHYNTTVESFAYPYGDSHNGSRDIVESSHALSVTTETRHIGESDDAHSLPRLRGQTPHKETRWELSYMGDIVNRILVAI